jgi:hypothetical protein
MKVVGNEAGSLCFVPLGTNRREDFFQDSKNAIATFCWDNADNVGHQVV